MPTILPTGFVHGRFQVFHNDHLDYCLQALIQTERIIVGLTHCVGLLPAVDTMTDRFSLSSNPLSYLDRVGIITEAFVKAGVLRENFTFTPFPIERPELLPLYIPTNSIAYTTIREEWNIHKVDLLRKIGYSVSVLKVDYDKQVTSSIVRNLIREGDDRWMQFVPLGVAEHMEAHGLLDKIRARA